ncbi:hypothetical protein K458DRAFT_406010 [Lentithecium fluviatile CBS 122367]|uniref:Uncharacterized protein n=1 Tax=Lentithecium fluviatile CBS 122367 TaxID=1168545 RepID=A0A6G1IWG1_9PLEO|nr:hypothetical protein K458DRAFT_406010 [Lentithecium fluviatile CBS 122367]
MATEREEDAAHGRANGGDNAERCATPDPPAAAHAVHGRFLTEPHAHPIAAAARRRMSPPNQAPQNDDVQSDQQQQKLENGAMKDSDAGIAVPDSVTKEDATPKVLEGPEEHSSGDAGQAPEPRNGAGEIQRTGEKVLMGGRSKEAEEAQSAELQAADTVQGEKTQPPAAMAEPMAEATEQAEAPARSSTPPREPTAKAAGKAPVRSPSPPPPPPKDEKYLSTSNVPSRTTSPVSQGKSSGRNSEDADAAEYAAKYDGAEDAINDSQAEIQSIMEQFEHGDGGPGAEEIMSPRLEIAQPMLESPTTHPPRRSSLIPIDKPLPTPTEEGSPEQPLQSPPPRTSSLYRVGTNPSLNEAMSPSAHAPQYQKPAPPPDPEPDLPFDFHRFLEQLRHRTADPVAKFLRSFLLEFGKKQWMVHEQVKIIGDFLEFISKKMGQCEVWRTVSDAEFDNAREGMEKLVMNRLYSQTFSPAIPPLEPVPHTKGRRRQEPLGPGRRGQHQEDVERDEVLAQKVRIYKWIREDHLDIKVVDAKGKKFLQLAQQELLKIKSYRAPRDKVICILNCCKVIFGYLRTSSSDQSADAFVPLLIYTVLQANPDHLVSNVQYILRFRNQDKLGGEAGYYISSLMGAIQFIEGLDRTSLTVSDEEFEKNVEAAVSAIAERHEPEPTTPDPTGAAPQLRLQTHPPTTPGHRRMPSPHSLHLSEKSSLARPEVTPRNSLDAEKAGPRRSTSLRNRNDKTEPDQPEEENAAVAGLLRTIQRPLSTIGRIFSDNDTSSNATSSLPASTPQPGSTPRLTPQPPQVGRRSSDYGPSSQQVEYNEKQRRSGEEERYRQRMSAEDAAARQASAEAEEARRIQRQEHNVVVETLAGMFPQLDRDVIDDVVRMKEGRVGLAVDACLALANP